MSGEVDEVAEALTGWTIHGVAWDPAVEGGLVLQLAREGRRKTVTLGFTELGMWVEQEDPGA